MAAIIFPNSSYFVALSAGATADAALLAFRERHRCRVHICRNYQEVEDAFQIMSRKLGLFVFADGVEASDVAASFKLADDYQVSGLLFSKGTGAPPPSNRIQLVQANEAQKMGQALDDFLNSLIPKNLEVFAIFCANLVFPGFFADIGEFKRIPNWVGPFQRDIVYFTVEGDLVGMCSLKVNMQKLILNWPGQDEEKAMGNLKEAVNQFLGVLTQNLSKVNINPKIGLPTVYDLSKIPVVETLAYFPSVHLSDQKQVLTLSLGYSHMENEPLFDLSAVSPSAPSDEIELL